MNDNNRVIKFTSDDGRRVYATHVKLTVECVLFILASDRDAARRAASFVDLQDYFTFDTHSLATDGPKVLRIQDVTTEPISFSTVNLTEIGTETYPPNEHPDFAGVPRR